jgi:hypothetical protein
MDDLIYDTHNAIMMPTRRRSPPFRNLMSDG